MMMRKLLLIVVLVSLTLSFICYAASRKSWAEFHSSEDFSVLYPKTWIQIGALNGLGVSKKQLQIVSSRGGTQGIVIRPGQGEIIVEAIRGQRSETLDTVVSHYIQGTSIISREVFHVSSKNPFGCQTIISVVSKESIIPAVDSPTHVPSVVYTQLFCQADQRKIVTILKNFEGDKQQAEWQAIALQMMTSVKMSPRRAGAVQRTPPHSPPARSR